VAALLVGGDGVGTARAGFAADRTTREFGLVFIEGIEEIFVKEGEGEGLGVIPRAVWESGKCERAASNVMTLTLGV
jgi:hypothetical protein